MLPIGPGACIIGSSNSGRPVFGSKVKASLCSLLTVVVSSSGFSTASHCMLKS